MSDNTSKTLAQIATAVFFLTVLAVLVANILLIRFACDLNVRVCANATQAGAFIAQQGGSESQIAQAVKQAVLGSNSGGYFVIHPHLHEVRVESIHGIPYLIVATVTGARVPAPMFVFNGTFGSDGRLLFYRKCIVSIKRATRIRKV